MASFAPLPGMFEITTPEATMSSDGVDATTEPNQHLDVLDLEYLLEQNAASASADPLDLWLQPLTTTSPPAEIFLEQLAPLSPFDTYANELQYSMLSMYEATPEEDARYRAALAAYAYATRRLRAHMRKTRGTREKKRETAPTKAILRAKQLARMKKRKDRARRESGSGADAGASASRA
ncbi:hypothetical protein L226DRAFT_573373 [Lentinus tigrinus ALCF2SS1-7]|uniref:Uncharacterized protein n=1 Tax=Lentinus tigrinus ALCF2SS1-6 TaxID=1328759 RepID=A0A5C2S1S2_9APHY|nr:hypothetical protein L227DRAFT_613657 [Lentinus tigrinus ALCF2SS1-6]RPD72000.1 hypothetical protein L226DRAFT_573373 [Lentinus tigrinus ALCF2SS1-7]